MADGSFAYNPFITSAMKGLTEAVNTALSDIEAGDWSDIAASNGNFGLEDGDYIGLPTDADSWNFETPNPPWHTWTALRSGHRRNIRRFAA